MRSFPHPLLVPALLLVGLAAYGQELPLDDHALRRAMQQGLDAAEDREGYLPLDSLLEKLAPLDEVALAQPPGGILSSEEAYQLLRKSVYILGIGYLCGRCDKRHERTSTAFALTRDGLMVTNHHVLEKGGGSAVVIGADGQSYPLLAVLALDPTNDLAIFEVETDDELVPLPLAEGLPAVGSPVFCLSHPKQNNFVFTDGVVARLARRPHGGPVIINVTAPYAQGSSGAPLIDRQGRVVSIVKSTRSLYTSPEEEHGQRHLQMVLRETIPADAVRRLIGLGE